MLTAKQKDLLLLLHRWVGAHGTAPSYEEMATEIGLRSKSGVHRLVAALEERGYILRLPGRARAVQVVRLPADHALAQSTVSEPKAVRVPLWGPLAPGVVDLRDTGRSVVVPAGILGEAQADACFALTVQDPRAGAGTRAGDTIILCPCGPRLPVGTTVLVRIDGGSPILRDIHNHGASIVLSPPGIPGPDLDIEPGRVRLMGRLIGLLRRYA
jgi:repressor LexA